MKKWFEAKAGNDEGVAHITIDGEIGQSWWDNSGVSSNDFMNAVKALGELTEIHIDVNSPGGAVTDGLTIANYLRQHSARVVANVLGQASSIASVITAAADEVHMGLGAFMFVHKASSGMWGNTDHLAAMAKDLATVDAGILDVYVARVGEERRAEIEALIHGSDGNGTLISAEQAVELGLADSMLEVRAVATIGSLVGCMQRGAVQYEDHVAHQGLITAVAEGLGVEATELQGDYAAVTAKIKTLLPEVEEFEITAEVLETASPELLQNIRAEAGTSALTAERERVTAIMKACATAGSFAHLDKLVTENWEADKAADYILAAASNQPPIHSTHSPEGGQRTGVDTKAIYARRNRKASN